ncbi:MAG: type II CAAX endopeptidase family protein [Rhizomicrobium sp.]|jgi:membrane protease YdiL (CAAX protease family)
MSSGTLDLLVLALAILVMPAMSARAGVSLARSIPESLVPRYWSTILRGWLAAILLLIVWWFAHRPLSDLGLDMPIGVRGRWAFVVDLVLIVFFLVQEMRLSSLSVEDFQTLAARVAALKVSPRTPAELFVFFLLSVTAGVWEELLYRGFLIWYLAARGGTLTAVILSSMIFGLGHVYQGWRGVLNTAFVGLAFGTLFVLTHSLWWLMAAHAIIDIAGGIVAYRVTTRMSAVKVNTN